MGERERERERERENYPHGNLALQVLSTRYYTAQYYGNEILKGKFPRENFWLECKDLDR